MAKGAILRAARKEEGPERFVKSSYGLLRKEYYDATTYQAHREASKSYDPIDGNSYVNTIEWLIHKVFQTPPFSFSK